MTNKQKTIILFILLATILVILSLSDNDNVKEVQAGQSKYCHMVKLHMVNPSFGWPDYNHNYEKICK